MCTAMRNLMHNACCHLWKGHGIDHHGSLPFDNKGSIRHTHLSVSMHNRHDTVHYFTHLLPRPGVHTLFTFSSDSALCTSWTISLNVAQRYTSASDNFILNSFPSTMPSSTSSRESIPRSSYKWVSGDKTVSLPTCTLMIFSTRATTFSCVNS